MKTKITCYFFFLSFLGHLNAQIFTQVTTGEIYNDSFSLGSAWGDFNNDTYPDLFASNGQLYQNNGDGTFTKITDGPVVENGFGIGGTVGDYNQDGFLDIYTASTGGSGGKLFQNNGDGTFTQILDEPFLSDTSDFQASSWVDIENDGDLDLYITAGGNEGYKDNHLYINNGDGTFTREFDNEIVQDSSGTVNCSWSDYNNDGFQDLFIATSAPGVDSFVNRLYLNNSDGSFTRIEDGAIVTDLVLALGSSWGDYNNDGFQDLFVAGTTQNKLYQNNGDNTFTSVDAGELTSEDFLSAGSGWEDFDNDGDLDLMIANIFSSNSLFENNGDGTFSKVNGEAFSLHGAFGCSWADWDRDGDLDILFTRTDNSNHIPYLNNGNSNNWINISCTGVISNTSAIGAKVWVKANINGNDIWQVREISGQTGVLGQSSLNAHFGLGTSETIDSIRVEWPSGIVQILSDVSINTHLEIIEDINLDTEDLYSTTGVNTFEIFPNPADQFANINFEINQPAAIELKVYDATGNLIKYITEQEYFIGSHTQELNIPDMSNGIYFCQLIIDNHAVFTKKLIIQH